MNVNHHHQPSRRIRRSLGAAVAIVLLGADVAACGDEDDVAPAAAQAAPSRANAEAAAHSDGHLEDKADEAAKAAKKLDLSESRSRVKAV
jgi:hypothetical protein